MANQWFAANFCPRDATCSEGTDALSPSNGPKIRTLVYANPLSEPLPAEVREFPDQESFFKAYTRPEDWAKCEGQLLPIAQNTELFSLVGTQYGGDGRTSFGLPDLRNSGTNDYYICVNGSIPGFTGP